MPATAAGSPDSRRSLHGAAAKAIAAALFAAAALTAAAAESAPVSKPAHAVWRGNGLSFWRDVKYGPRADYPDEGDGFRGQVGDWRPAAGLPGRICRHCSGQTMDLYVPDTAAGKPATVVMYVHGGAWSHCFDKWAIPGALFRAYMKRGVVLCSPNYILQIDNTMNMQPGRRDEATFGAMLRDIDLAVARLKPLLSEAGVKMDRFVMAGESAGAHLALLYSYDQDNPGALSLGLRHDIKICKAVDIVGPTDFFAMNEASGADAASLPDSDPRQRYRVLMKRLAGLADDAPEKLSLERIAAWSPVSLVTSRSVPTSFVYGRILPLVPTDGMIPLSQKRSLEKALEAAGVRFESKIVTGVHHGDVSTVASDWIADQCISH